jgi:hypothetical protein
MAAPIAMPMRRYLLITGGAGFIAGLHDVELMQRP